MEENNRVGYRRVFIIRKDLHMKPGKLAAMVGHCCEAYWTNILKNSVKVDHPGYVGSNFNLDNEIRCVEIDRNIWDNYVNGIFTKTICEARNLNNLKKVENTINDLNLNENTHLIEGIDYGYINDKCLTDLTPENSDGTCTVGIWFKPLPDDIAHKISKKYPLYRDE